MNHNFKVDDWVICTETSTGGGFTKDHIYKIKKLHNNEIHTYVDNRGSQSNGWGTEHFKIFNHSMWKKGDLIRRIRQSKDIEFNTICEVGETLNLINGNLDLKYYGDGYFPQYFEFVTRPGVTHCLETTPTCTDFQNINVEKPKSKILKFLFG